MCENVLAHHGGTKSYQAWSDRQCGFANGRPNEVNGLCTSPSGETGEERPTQIVGIKNLFSDRRSQGANLKEWRWSPSAMMVCSPTVKDAFGLGQDVVNEFQHPRSSAWLRGYEKCVDGIHVAGCARRSCLRAEETHCECPWECPKQ